MISGANWSSSSISNVGAVAGIYSNTGGRPVNLLGSVSINLTTGGTAYSAALSTPVTLAAGWYWLASNQNTNSPMVTPLASDATMSDFIGSTPLSQLANSSLDQCLIVPATFAALPSTFPTSGVVNSNSPAVVYWLASA